MAISGDRTALLMERAEIEKRLTSTGVTIEQAGTLNCRLAEIQRKLGEGPCCSECGSVMGPDEIGDELPEERVCDACAGIGTQNNIIPTDLSAIDQTEIGRKP